jgi:hypothetical protein
MFAGGAVYDVTCQEYCNQVLLLFDCFLYRLNWQSFIAFSRTLLPQIMKNFTLSKLCGYLHYYDKL